MVDIQSATTENRRGKKTRKQEKKPLDENVMACPVGGHNSCQYVSLVEQPTTGDSDVISVCSPVRRGCRKNQDLGDEQTHWKG